MVKVEGVVLDRGGMTKAIQILSELSNSSRTQSHYNAHIKNSIVLSSGEGADRARYLNSLVGEIVKEQALLNALTLALAQNIQNDFTELDDNLASSFRESF